MLDDYKLFGDLVVFDTTYRTNKYDMICAPFVGMNHHANNVMFGCRFLMNEEIGSFVWLFETFLKSMGGKHPITVMTDQAFSMASAIKLVFPHARHRLCCWHIIENSRKNIGRLRSCEGFTKLFNRVLMDCDTVDEFEVLWERMMEKYDCRINRWLCNLYMLREKWCLAFSKHYFFGGVLSSQRSESTNRSLKRRLRATSDLCDFYNIFCDVVSEWRSKENGEDHRCSKGNVEISFPSIHILKHAMSVYTVEAFMMFEKEFIDGAGYNYKAVESSSCAVSFDVWGIKVARESTVEECYEFRHNVTFKKDEGVVECTCKRFTEVGILCSHCLRVLHACCVEQVPDLYIIKRWCKGIKDCQQFDIDITTGKDHVGCSSVWKMQMMRKMNSIITASQMNKNARAHCEKYFIKLKELVEIEVGSIHVGEDGQGKDLGSQPNVLNPPAFRQKGVRNKRFKSIVEKKCDQVRRRKSKKLEKSNVDSCTPPYQNGHCVAIAPLHTGISYSQMLQQISLPTFTPAYSVLYVQRLGCEGAIESSSCHLSYHFHSSSGSSVLMPLTAGPGLEVLNTNTVDADGTHDDHH